jgi:hypothetical protein
MTDKEIFELAEEYGEWDDFGRWTFRTDDKLLRFVVAVQEAEKQEPLVWMNKYGHVASFKNDEYTAPLYTAPVHASDEFAEMVEKGTKAWADTPDDWVDDLRGGAEKHEWVGLTDKERFLNDARSEEEIEYAQAIEAKLKEKNA